MSATAILAADVVHRRRDRRRCPRDPATAAAGILGALVLGIIAILSRERDDRYDCSDDFRSGKSTGSGFTAGAFFCARSLRQP
jgi:hypothetical protein